MIAINGRRGTIDKPLRNAKCEMHDNVPAVWSVITEPSIFGAEWTLMCRECYEQFIAANNLTGVGWCEECEHHHVLHNYPHPDRGVIRVCHECDYILDEELSYQEELNQANEDHQ